MMVNDDHQPLTELARDVAPPRALRSRVESELAARGLLRRNRWSAMVTAAAAVVIAFGAGWSVGASPEAPAAGEQFVLLLYEPASYRRGAREERVAEYGAWASSLGSAMTLGEELGADARVLGDDQALANGSQPTGLFVIRSSDWESALAVARSCPHLRYGGIVVVRPIIT